MNPATFSLNYSKINWSCRIHLILCSKRLFPNNNVTIYYEIFDPYVADYDEIKLKFSHTPSPDIHRSSFVNSSFLETFHGIATDKQSHSKVCIPSHFQYTLDKQTKSKQRSFVHRFEQ